MSQIHSRLPAALAIEMTVRRGDDKPAVSLSKQLLVIRMTKDVVRAPESGLEGSKVWISGLNDYTFGIISDMVQKPNVVATIQTRRA